MCDAFHPPSITVIRSFGEIYFFINNYYYGILPVTQCVLELKKMDQSVVEQQEAQLQIQHQANKFFGVPLKDLMNEQFRYKKNLKVPTFIHDAVKYILRNGNVARRLVLNFHQD